MGAVAQTVTGLGFSLISAPVLVFFYGVQQGVFITVVLALAVSGVSLLKQRGDVYLRGAVTLLIPTLLATPVVAWLLTGVDSRKVAVAAGVTVLAGAGLVQWWMGLSLLVGVLAGSVFASKVSTGVARVAVLVVAGLGGVSLIGVNF